MLVRITQGWRQYKGLVLIHNMWFGSRRVGRTARMGRSGNAVVYLLPHESSYVEFLRLRKIPLVEVQLAEDAPSNVVPSLRSAAEGDREVMEKVTPLNIFDVAYNERLMTE